MIDPSTIAAGAVAAASLVANIVIVRGFRSAVARLQVVAQKQAAAVEVLTAAVKELLAPAIAEVAPEPLPAPALAEPAAPQEPAPALPPPPPPAPTASEQVLEAIWNARAAHDAYAHERVHVRKRPGFLPSRRLVAIAQRAERELHKQGVSVPHLELLALVKEHA